MKIGVIGLGTVGLGVVHILTEQKERLERELKQEIDIKYACALEKVDLPEGIIYTTDFNDVLNDPEVDTVVELIGGLTFAKTIILSAFEKGKNVVSANKALIAHEAKELFDAANRNNVHFYYEASVGGGIPVVIPERESLIGNEIQKIEGILNGTTNFILTLMETEGLSYKAALGIAQDNGFVEANAALDLDGIDAAHKIAILTMNAFRTYIDFDSIITRGIGDVTKLDIDIAKKIGYRIKLLANAKKTEDGIEIDVSPTLVSLKSMISNVNQSYNVVEITNNYVENVLFYGKGAGRYVTASAVVADILKTLNTEKWDYSYYTTTSNIKPITYSQYYIRSNHQLNIRYKMKTQIENDYVYITDYYELKDLQRLLEGESYQYFKVRD